MAMSKQRGRWFVSLVDEEDPDGPVKVWNEDRGGGDMTMPQDVFWALREAEFGDQSVVSYSGVDVVRLPPTLAHLR